MAGPRGRRYWTSNSHTSISIKYASIDILKKYFTSILRSKLERDRIATRIRSLEPGSEVMIILPGLLITNSDKIRNDQITRIVVKDIVANQEVPCIVAVHVEDEDYVFDHYSQEQFLEMINV